ncbi:MAG TPA: carboxylesterase family protein [Solirubrobacteraceae bacterium]
MRFGRRQLTILCATVAAALWALGLAGYARAAAPACSSGTTVQTANGPVCGTTASGLTDYLDIPYAAPPVGALRWAPPQAAKSWTSVYTATQRPAECPSPTFPSGGVQSGTSEDCLYLEVQEPASTKPGAKLPVMVEIHGGGFLGEYRDDDGTNLINTGPAIYVYVEYRLGILGFLADKALGAHSGDYGLMDQQAGLRWVKQNIGAFGGDPDNVTIFGESAGGASVCDQVASPTAKGLFERGISVSGFYNFNVNTIWWQADCKSKLQTEAQAQKGGAAFAASVGCGGAKNTAACLRAVPVATLVKNAGSYETPNAGGSIGPIVNGTTLPMPAAKAFNTGHVNKVKLIIGVGRDEFNGGVYTNELHTVIANTPAQYQQLVAQQFGSLAPKVMQLYPLDRFPAPAPFIAYRTVMADAFSVCPALQTDAQLSRYIPVYAYEDDDADSPSAGETQPLGAYHSAINRLVHDAPSSLDPNQAALQSQVLAQWTGFAHDGDPNAPGTPLWTRYGSGSRDVMSLVPAGDSTLTPTSTLKLQHNCAFWDAVNRHAPWSVG